MKLERRDWMSFESFSKARIPASIQTVQTLETLCPCYALCWQTPHHSLCSLKSGPAQGPWGLPNAGVKMCQELVDDQRNIKDAPSSSLILIASDRILVRFSHHSETSTTSLVELRQASGYASAP
jgi:hypothetical protein